MKSNIVYQYFKKESKQETVYIQYDSIQLKGARLSLIKDELVHEEVEFTGSAIEDLKADGFIEANALEYHLVLKGLA